MKPDTTNNNQSTGDASTHQTEDTPDDSISLTPSVREYIKTSRDHACELCDNDSSQLEIHHRHLKSEGGTNHPDNLILLCRECHQRHHGNEPIEPTEESNTDQNEDESSREQYDDDVDLSESSTDAKTTHDADPLPPRSEPNGADKEILSLIEKEGPLSTGEIAARTEYTGQYIRRQCWKLSGEQLIAPRNDSTWDLAERTNADQLQIGLPDTPKSAARAGRDEVIRQMSAHGISHTQIADISDLSRSTIDIAVNRARALRLDMDEPTDVDFATIATRLSALVELIDHSRIDPR